MRASAGQGKGRLSENSTSCSYIVGFCLITFSSCQCWVLNNDFFYTEWFVYMLYLPQLCSSPGAFKITLLPLSSHVTVLSVVWNGIGAARRGVPDGRGR